MYLSSGNARMSPQCEGTLCHILLREKNEQMQGNTGSRRGLTSGMPGIGVKMQVMEDTRVSWAVWIRGEQGWCPGTGATTALLSIERQERAELRIPGCCHLPKGTQGLSWDLEGQ